jgi:alkyl hydroperoxide reductase subunit AhpC
MMLQKNVTCYYENPGPNPFLINPNGTMEELQMNKFSSSYLCLVVFRGAMEPLSSLELMNFSNNSSKFQDLDCMLVGMARDSPMVLQDWMLEPTVGRGKKVSATFPCISCPNIGADDVGLIQAVGVPLVQGFPIPTIIIVDRQDKVRAGRKPLSSLWCLT